jgi:hypothetical protein
MVIKNSIHPKKAAVCTKKMMFGKKQMETVL